MCVYCRTILNTGFDGIDSIIFICMFFLPVWQFRLGGGLYIMFV